MRYKHDDRKIICSYCEKKFTTNKALTEHEYVHTKERPYSCTVCDKTFNNSGTRYRHIQTCPLVLNAELGGSELKTEIKPE